MKIIQTLLLLLIVLISSTVLASNPKEDIVRESVDLIELNHFYDEHGCLVFDQIIFYDWSNLESRYNVRAWRLVKNPEQLPQKDWSTGGYAAMWQDAEQMRQIRSKEIRETWTQWDVELIERDFLPKEKRKELKTPKRVIVKKPVPQQNNQN